MKTLHKKLEKLQQQQRKINDEVRALLKQRNEELLKVLNHLPSPALDPLVLVGGLLYIIDEAAKNPLKKEEWLKAGGKFQRRPLLSKAADPLNEA